jgi:hypothetical protein
MGRGGAGSFGSASSAWEKNLPRASHCRAAISTEGAFDSWRKIIVEARWAAFYLADKIRPIIIKK